MFAPARLAKSIPFAPTLLAAIVTWASAFSLAACAGATGQHDTRPAAKAVPASTSSSATPGGMPAVGPSLPTGDAGPACEPLRVSIPPAAREPLDLPVPRIEDDDFAVMAPFFERLARLIRGRADDHVRIGFFGDSNMTLDLISGSMRRTIQKLHGDGGHGYVAVGKPWRWYDHLDVEHAITGEWSTHAPTTVRIRRNAYGLGGITSATREIGARATFATAGPESPVGRTASKFGVFYRVSSAGGTFEVRVDGEVRATVDTTQGQGTTGYHVVHVPDAPHTFEVVNTGKRLMRVYGVTLERDEPGIVLDCLGIGGVSYFDLGRFDPDTNTSMLRQRGYDLVMYLIGANTWKASENPAAVKSIAALLRSVKPDQPILIMSPPDHTKRIGDASSDPQFVRIASRLRTAALDEKCAFWDLREAMGGEGSMSRFFHAGLAAKDLYHFTRKGAAFMGSRVLHALFTAFAAYLESHPNAGCS